MSPALLGIGWAAVFAVPVSLLSRLRSPIRPRIRPRRRPVARPRPRSGTHAGGRPAEAAGSPAEAAGSLSWPGVAWLLGINVALLFGIDSVAFYFGRPMMTFAGLVPLILLNLVILAIAVTVATRGRPNAGSVASALAIVTFGTVWLVGHNSGHNAYQAAHLVSVTVAPGDELPASSTDHMVIVSPDIATTRASQAMSTGIAGQRNYSTFLQLGPATLQYVDARMWYVFPLEFDGAGDKARLHAIVPGYIMVSAEDPNATPVEHYDGTAPGLPQGRRLYLPPHQGRPG